MIHPIVHLVRPDVPMHRAVWNRNDAPVSSVAIQGSVPSTTIVIVARQSEILVAVFIQPIWLSVELGVNGWAIKVKLLRLWDVDNTAQIEINKIYSLVPDGWCWGRRGGVLVSVVLILYEEIAYISPHASKFNKNIFFFHLGGLQFIVDIIWTAGGNKVLDFVDKGTFF